MKNFNIKYETGRSMIEMLGVLAIIGVLSVGGIAGYSKAMMKYRINKTIEQISLIAGNARTFFTPQGNYDNVQCSCYDNKCSGQSTDDGCPIIKKAKIFPDEMLTFNSSGNITAIENAFGGKFIISKANRFANYDDKAFYISLSGIPEEACIELAIHNWQNIDALAVTVGSEASAPMVGYVGDYWWTGEGCKGNGGIAPLLGCQNGTTVSLPLPFDKVIEACAISSEISIKFR